MKTKIVPVSDPAHPSHATWLEIMLGVFQAAAAIGPAIVAIVDPADATEATEIGKIAQAGLAVVPQ